MELRERKSVLRAGLREQLRALTPSERRAGGRAVLEHLRPMVAALARGADDPVVGLFASLPWEIDTTPIAEGLAAMGVGRALPAYRTNDLEFHRLPEVIAFSELPVDRLGIPTPLEEFRLVRMDACVAVLVPGLGFDVAGRRLGQGGGYYDRAIGRLRAAEGTARPQLIGIGMDLQRLESVPTESHDQRVDLVITPSGRFPDPAEGG